MEQLVEAVAARLESLVRSLSRHRWQALVGAALAAIVLAGVVSVVPNRYEAMARVYVDTQTALKPLMQGLTYQLDSEVQVTMLARTLISQPNMERLLRSEQLQVKQISAERREELVARLMEKIKLRSTGSDNLFEVSYRDRDPVFAQNVVQSTVDLFVHEGVVAKRRDSMDAGRFIEEQIRAYEVKLVEAENRLKDFKSRNFGVSGVAAQDYFSRVSTLFEDVSRIRTELNAAVRARDSYRRELEEESPHMATDILAATPALAELQARVEAQHKVVDELRLRYTDAHPDLQNARRILADMQAEFDAMKVAASSESRTPQGRRVAPPTNPVYQKLRLSLAEAEAQVASLQSQLAAKQAALDQARAVGGRMPAMEAELAQLNRDYDVIRRNYDLLVGRREAAMLGTRLDESSRMAEFRVIDPPKVADRPVFPSRLHLALMAVAATLGAGLFAAQLTHARRRVVEDVETLREISGRPVIGVVGLTAQAVNVGRKRAEGLRFGLAMLLLMMAQGAWVGWVAVQDGVSYRSDFLQRAAQSLAEHARRVGAVVSTSAP